MKRKSRWRNCRSVPRVCGSFLLSLPEKTVGNSVWVHRNLRTSACSWLGLKQTNKKPTVIPMNWKDWFALCLFLMSILANDKLHVVSCLHAECKTKPLGCTPKPRRQVDSAYVCNTITSQHRHNVYNTMCTTRSFFLANVITKTLWSFPDLTGYTSLSVHSN